MSRLRGLSSLRASIIGFYNLITKALCGQCCLEHAQQTVGEPLQKLLKKESLDGTCSI